MEAILAEQGVSFQFVEAVDGSSPNAGFNTFWSADPRRGLLNAGEIGCMLSHIAIWRRLVAEGIACSIVLEDDLCLGRGFGKLVAKLGTLPDLGLLKLETDCDPVVTEAKPATSVGLHDCHQLIGGAGRTGAYAIWQSAAIQLLSCVDSFVDSVDIEMFRPRQTRPGWPDIYQLVPAICVQAELVPGVAGSVPFLESSIESYGERRDARLGLRRKREARSQRVMRRILRPIKHGVFRIWYRVFGLRHQVVDYVESIGELNGKDLAGIGPKGPDSQSSIFPMRQP